MPQVIVYYPGEWYWFTHINVNAWIDEIMQYYDIHKNMAGLGFGERDVSGHVSGRGNMENILAFVEEISCYPGVRVTVIIGEE